MGRSGYSVRRGSAPKLVKLGAPRAPTRFRGRGRRRRQRALDVSATPAGERPPACPDSSFAGEAGAEAEAGAGTVGDGGTPAGNWGRTVLAPPGSRQFSATRHLSSLPSPCKIENTSRFSST